MKNHTLGRYGMNKTRICLLKLLCHAPTSKPSHPGRLEQGTRRTYMFSEGRIAQYLLHRAHEILNSFRVLEHQKRPLQRNNP
jgi:hypothetical protein